MLLTAVMLLIGLIWLAKGLVAVQRQPKLRRDFPWEKGPKTLSLAQGVATLFLPEGTEFTGAEGTNAIMSQGGNLPDATAIGFITDAAGPFRWYLILYYLPGEQRSDDDAMAIAAEPAVLLESICGQTRLKEQQLTATKASIGQQAWWQAPRYDTERHVMRWVMQVSDVNGSEHFNHTACLLGRMGMLRLDCITDTDTDAMPVIERIFDSIRFQPGYGYEDVPPSGKPYEDAPDTGES